ncbi:F-box/kelch-repeat protein At3g06240-like [Mercurialis annua]|uniref:F-box/kelch-repeat protein At3g06240-like n=1 Tax=Mercurialis annua TaxID=3986 RepID=UPI0021605DD3|nr:F-box/kelch-repeat protein At3g06240-like [Mercurialis annua]
MKKTKKMSEYLPEEVVLQILSRLPVKSILKFRCVCKLWNCIVKNPHFISAFSSNNHNHYFFLRHSYASYQDSRLRFDNKHLDHYLRLYPPSDKAKIISVVASSNGLVCLSGASQKFILWNPSIRKSLMVPESTFPRSCPNSKTVLGFGFDSRTNDYKLLMARFLVHSISEVFLYSLNSNSWKKILVACKYREGIDWLIDTSFVDGRFYWPIIAEKKNVVLVFDLRNEMFAEITLPECLEYVDKSYLKMKAFGESSIAVIHQNARDSSYESNIWVMKEYTSGAWMNLATVGKRWRGDSNVLEFRDNGEVLVSFYSGQCLASYNIKNGRIKKLIYLDYRYERVSAYRHVESLALLDKVYSASLILWFPFQYNICYYYKVLNIEILMEILNVGLVENTTKEHSAAMQILLEF